MSSAPFSAPPPPPLVVDLDGTLIKTDLLLETTNQLLTRQPWQIFRLCHWLAQGRSRLKAHLAMSTTIDAASLPYNEALIAWLKQQKSQGRPLVLATASHHQLAEQVAEHLGIFDQVLATRDDINLKSHHKRDLLVSQYPDRGFGYVGNDWADIVVMESAVDAYLVSHSPRLIATAKSLGNLTQTFESNPSGSLTAFFTALRPHQWLKNLLIFIPLLAAHRYGSGSSLVSALLAFIVFGLTASSVYLLNDLVDIADDRQHPRKRQRPFAAGNLSLLHGWLAWPSLLLLAFAIASLTLPASFVATLSIYFVLTVAYSLYLKHCALIDVLTLAILYTVRIIAGAAAISVQPTFWLLAFSMFIFLSLAFIKRFTELRSARNAKHQGQLRGRDYYPEDLELVSSLGAGAGYLAVLVLALYIEDPRTAELYRNPKLIWLACPLLLYWICRAWLMAHRGLMHDDPIVFALKDRSSWVVGALLASVFILAKVMS